MHYLPDSRDACRNYSPIMRQIKSMRGMNAMQGDMAKLQAKYKGKKDQLSRQANGAGADGTIQEAWHQPLLILSTDYRADADLSWPLSGAHGCSGQPLKMKVFCCFPQNWLNSSMKPISLGHYLLDHDESRQR